MAKAKLMDMRAEDYFDMPHLNFSTAKHIKSCPRKFRHVMTHGIGTTSAMEIGTAVHTAVLEPRKFKREYKCAPDCRRGTKAWKEFAEKNPKATILKEREYNEVCAMRNSLAKNTEAMSLLDGGYTESVITWEDEATGLDLKCRIDKCIMTDDDAIIIDLKTTLDASPRSMAARMVQAPYNYLLQMAWYQRGFEAAFTVKPRAVIIAIEKSAGYPTAAYDINPTDMDMAQAEVSEMLDMVATAYENNEEEGHYPRRFLTLPKWYYNDTEEESTI